MIWFGLVLWHINDCKLFNVKSSLYIYVIYMISKIVYTQFNVCKYFQVSQIIQLNINNFFYTQLKDQMFYFKQFSLA